MNTGFHTDAFNSVYWSFEQCLRWARQQDLHYIECGAIDGVSWIHGLGYQPHVALWEDPCSSAAKWMNSASPSPRSPPPSPSRCPRAPPWASSTCSTPSAGLQRQGSEMGPDREFEFQPP